MKYINMSVCFILIFAIFSSYKKKKFEHNYEYQAIKGNDTAMLYLSIHKNSFYGQYEILNGRTAKDSGDISGKISGDTLIGTYFYYPYSGKQKKRIPFVLLKKNQNYILGKGVITSYMGIPYYVKEIGIDFEKPDYIFKKLDLP